MIDFEAFKSLSSRMAQFCIDVNQTAYFLGGYDRQPEGMQSYDSDIKVPYDK